MKRSIFVGAALLAMALSATSGLAAGAATIIKIATVAPDGTAWMKEMRAAPTP